MNEEKKIKVWHLNYSDIYGGAARAAYRIHKALLSDGVFSSMHVMRAKSDDPTVYGPSNNFKKAVSLLRSYLGSLVKNIVHTNNPTIHSAAMIPSRWPAIINKSGADIINLHWITGEMMSVKDIAKIDKPCVWTLHDMWAFSGAEHIVNNERWIEGYTAENRPDDEKGIDINRWTWNRKKKHWRNKIQIVVPSEWLARCVRSSKLMKDWPVEVIPNALDTKIWFPAEKSVSRSLLKVDKDVPLIVFGAFDGTRDPNKGFDLLMSALNRLKNLYPDLHIIVFGERKPGRVYENGLNIIYRGHFYDDISLRVIYSAADAVIVPSRQEAFGQTAVEAMACGKPVVAFKTGGLPEIISHKKTGWLAEAFDTEDLANGIAWILEDESRAEKMGMAARLFAKKHFSAEVISKSYQNLYQRILETS